MSAVALYLPQAFLSPPAYTAASPTELAARRRELERPLSITLDDILSERVAALARACESASVQDWDGEQATAVTAATYRAAQEFLDALPSSAGVPEIAAHPDGDIEFEWFVDSGHVLTVSISGENVLHYAALIDNRPPLNGRTEFAGTIPAPIASVLSEVALPTT